jgi:hypothetical protein
MAKRGLQAFRNIFGRRVPVTHTPLKQVTTTGQTQWSKGYPGPKIQGTKFLREGPDVTKQIFEPKTWAAKTGKYLEGTPEWKIMKGIYEGKGMVTKPIKYALKSPLLMGGLIWTGVNWVRKDGSPASTDEIAQNKAKHGPFDHTETEKKLTKKAQAAFAEAQRDTRVKKYLDLMGYDRSKKTAVADALIDASKIVSERGSLKGDVTRELINPIIQATSKRFDKPEQIREAVGLMMVKAGLEKEMYEAKPGAVAKSVQDMVKSGRYTEEEAWAIATKEPRGPSEVITSHMASRRGSLNDKDLAILMRDYGAKNDIPVEVYTTKQLTDKYGKDGKPAMDIIIDEKITDDGIYVIGREVIQITGGKPLQLA